MFRRLRVPTSVLSVAQQAIGLRFIRSTGVNTEKFSKERAFVMERIAELNSSQPVAVCEQDIQSRPRDTVLASFFGVQSLKLSELREAVNIQSMACTAESKAFGWYCRVPGGNDNSYRPLPPLGSGHVANHFASLPPVLTQAQADTLGPSVIPLRSWETLGRTVRDRLSLMFQHWDINAEDPKKWADGQYPEEGSTESVPGVDDWKGKSPMETSDAYIDFFIAFAEHAPEIEGMEKLIEFIGRRSHLLTQKQATNALKGLTFFCERLTDLANAANEIDTNIYTNKQQVKDLLLRPALGNRCVNFVIITARAVSACLKHFSATENVAGTCTSPAFFKIIQGETPEATTYSKECLGMTPVQDICQNVIAATRSLFALEISSDRLHRHARWYKDELLEALSDVISDTDRLLDGATRRLLYGGELAYWAYEEKQENTVLADEHVRMLLQGIALRNGASFAGKFGRLSSVNYHELVHLIAIGLPKALQRNPSAWTLTASCETLSALAYTASSNAVTSELVATILHFNKENHGKYIESNQIPHVIHALVVALEGWQDNDETRMNCILACFQECCSELATLIQAEQAAMDHQAEQQKIMEEEIKKKANTEPPEDSTKEDIVTVDPEEEALRIEKEKVLALARSQLQGKYIDDDEDEDSEFSSQQSKKRPEEEEAYAEEEEYEEPPPVCSPNMSKLMETAMCCLGAIGRISALSEAYASRVNGESFFTELHKLILKTLKIDSAESAQDAKEDMIESNHAGVSSTSFAVNSIHSLALHSMLHYMSSPRAKESECLDVVLNESIKIQLLIIKNDRGFRQLVEAMDLVALLSAFTTDGSQRLSIENRNIVGEIVKTIASGNNTAAAEKRHALYACRVLQAYLMVPKELGACELETEGGACIAPTTLLTKSLSDTMVSTWLLKQDTAEVIAFVLETVARIKPGLAAAAIKHDAWWSVPPQPVRDESAAPVPQVESWPVLWAYECHSKAVPATRRVMPFLRVVRCAKTVGAVPLRPEAAYVAQVMAYLAPHETLGVAELKSLLATLDATKQA